MSSEERKCEHEWKFIEHCLSDYVSLQRLAYTGDIRAFDGLADWKHRLKAAGNGQCPRVVKEAWNRLANDNR